jgi:hypothetical protein
VGDFVRHRYRLQLHDRPYRLSREQPGDSLPLLAIADDALGLILLAAFYLSAPVQPLPFVILLGAACALAWMLRRKGTKPFP